ncbi:EamA family transporter [Bacillus sp. D386]|uniref:EamA family transporter n=1 Tax=Bacillus sp. D386 TaxID=2587155 RepID=UPI001120FD60|nr:GRP family sugar transporter [Bacillus sp. D386]
MSILLALLAALFAALTSILAKIGINNVNSNLATAIRTFVVLIMAYAVVRITGQWDELYTIHPKAWIFIILSGITTGLSWLCFFKAIQIGDVSKVVPIDKSSVIITIILSFIILQEPLTPLVIAGGVVITIGTFILIGKREKKKKEGYLQSYIFLAVLSAVFAALTSILAKIGIEDVDSNVATFIRTVVILIFAWSIVFFQRTQKDLKTISNRSYLFLILSGIATGLSWLCYFAAIQIGQVSIVAPIDKFSVVITMVLSFIILKEKPNKNTIIGGIAITIGTILLIF